jgi:hypothetical protein
MADAHQVATPFFSPRETAEFGELPAASFFLHQLDRKEGDLKARRLGLAQELRACRGRRDQGKSRFFAVS